MFDSSLQVFLVTSVLITALPAPPLFTFSYLYTAEHRWHEDWSQFTIRSLSYQLHLLAPRRSAYFLPHELAVLDPPPDTEPTAEEDSDDTARAAAMGDDGSGSTHEVVVVCNFAGCPCHESSPNTSKMRGKLGLQRDIFGRRFFRCVKGAIEN